MENNEAMSRLRSLIPRVTEEENAAIELALIALRKQIAKRPFPTLTDDPDVTYYQCPMCGSYEYDDYCGHCGQRLGYD